MKEVIKSFNPIKWIPKINTKVVVFAISIVVLLFLIHLYRIMTATLPEVENTLKDNKNLQSKIDSINADNQFMAKRIHEMEKNQAVFFDMISKNNELIKQNNKQLDKLKKVYNDQINNANTYNVSQLDSFFTNRYRDYYNR